MLKYKYGEQKCVNHWQQISTTQNQMDATITVDFNLTCYLLVHRILMYQYSGVFMHKTEEKKPTM